MEKWKEISNSQGRFGCYEVSSYGRLRNSRGTILNPTTTIHGYLKLGYRSGEIYKNVSVHRLVAIAFIPNPDNKRVVNHLDGNKFNNHKDNLKWCTDAENVLHQYRVLGQEGPWKGKFGGNHNTSKKVSQFTKDGEFIMEYNSLIEAERATGADDGHISSVCKNKRKTAGGFVWRYS